MTRETGKVQMTDAKDTVILGPWEEGRCRICIRGHNIEVFHIYGIPPRMNQLWFRAKYGDQLDPVPMATKFTALVKRLERKFV